MGAAAESSRQDGVADGGGVAELLECGADGTGSVGDGNEGGELPALENGFTFGGRDGGEVEEGGVARVVTVRKCKIQRIRMKDRNVADAIERKCVDEEPMEYDEHECFNHSLMSAASSCWFVRNKV